VSEPAFAFAELIKLVVALGVTIGLFYALALFMKRMQVGTGRSGNLITVLAALPLGGKEKLWVVEVAGEKLLIGTTPGNVNCLHVLPQGEALASADLATPAPSTKPEGTAKFAGEFARLLQNFRGGEKS
jgi:flagellar protein FliO/FliZ